MTLESILPIPDLFLAKRILCIQPHYDDNDIAASGILARLAQNGAEIIYLTATDDLMGVVDASLSDDKAASCSNGTSSRQGKSWGSGSNTGAGIRMPASMTILTCAVTS